MKSKPSLLAVTMILSAACVHAQTQAPGQVTHISDKAYSGKSSVTTHVKGQPQQMGMEMTGKWLGADCGAVKPIGALTTK